MGLSDKPVIEGTATVYCPRCGEAVKFTPRIEGVMVSAPGVFGIATMPPALHVSFAAMQSIAHGCAKPERTEDAGDSQVQAPGHA